ncbi:MAG: hypothetical protein HY974_03605 [Candidatus Kerfeldbacteria bacterium]|nr:hypothetical protein [Candidatus Kerfeldbacteria bacterium]
MSMAAYRPVTKALLAFVAGLGDSAVEFGSLWSALATGYGSAYRRGGSAYVSELKRFKKQIDLKRKINELARRRYIRVRRLGRSFVISLTDKGQAATVISRLRQAQAHPRGWHTVVIFDIPEEMSNARKLLRALLKQGGFKRLQQSVWVSKADAYNTMVEFVKHSRVEAWVNVYYATQFLSSPQ